MKLGGGEGLNLQGVRGKLGDLRFGQRKHHEYYAHFADLPMIVSGGKVAYLDPQQKIWRDKEGVMQSGHRYDLCRMQQAKYRNSLMPLYNIASFRASGISCYPSTLFRFPLRTESTLGLISKAPCDVSKVLDLLETFKEEAKFLLLFLRSVESIEVYSIDPKGRNFVQFSAKIVGESCNLRKERFLFKTNLEESFKLCNCYGLSSSTPKIFTAKCTVRVTEKSGLDSHSSWLVANRVGSNDHEIIKTANELCVFPWVGTALNLSVPIDSGRIFCVIPLPAEVTTLLPVHINGTFSLNDDRRSLKWPGKERKGEAVSKWNELLVNKLIPQCYALLLKKALFQDIAASEFYKAIPDVQHVSQSMWGGLLEPLFAEVFRKACFWSLAGRWVTVEEAVFVPRDRTKLVVDTVLTDCGYYVVVLPPNMWQVLLLTGKSYQVVTPKLAREALKAHRNSYECKTYKEKHEILQYCLSDSEYCLNGLFLLPLASGDFVEFQTVNSSRGFVYICTKECPRELFPNAEKFLVDSLHGKRSLKAFLEHLAISEQTQLRMLDAKGVASLLPHVLPREWRDQVEVSVDASCSISLKWFEMFWKWVKNQNLELFAGKFLVPIVHKTSGFTSVMKLQPNSPVISIQKHEVLQKEIRSVLSKLGIKYTEAIFLKHEKLTSYLKSLSPGGVLATIKMSIQFTRSLQDINLSAEEATALQNFVVRSADLLPHEQVLSNLSIFFPIVTSLPKSLMSLKKLAKTIMLEPSDYHIMRDVTLPPSFEILCKEKNQPSLLSVCSQVEFPESTELLLKKYIFPNITNGTISIADFFPLMQHVLANLSHLYSSAEDIAGICFIPNSSQKLASPKMLYDPSSTELKDLFRGEPMFPLKPFDEEPYLLPLRECGLKVSVVAQDLYDILIKIAGKRSLEDVGKVRASRARAVFRYIKEHSKLLDDVVTVGQSSTQLLKEAIHNLAKRKSILPIEFVPPPKRDYPECLPWKGSDRASYLTSLNSTVQVCTDQDFTEHSNLAGSQLYIVNCSHELHSIVSLPCHFRGEHILRHLVEIINHQNQLKNDVDSRASFIYFHLEHNFNSLLQSFTTIDFYNREWIWYTSSEISKFVRPCDITLEKHPNFHHDLSPYIYIFPAKFRKLFTHFGAHEKVTDELLVSVLLKVKERCLIVPGPRSWQVVTDILNWLTDNGRKPARKEVGQIYVPVESSSRPPELVRVEDATYVDGKHMRRLLNKDKDIKVIHKDFEHLAKYLGVTPLSKRLNISADMIGNAGQTESLENRLKSILRDYEGGLTIVKELIQNADDAGATEVNICYDAREHVVDEGDLRFPGMVRAHGPALLFHNNSIFSDADFENIQKLAGATKRDKPLKIGNFGIGFCSVYHVTDVPSFVSREWLYIFDPRLEYLQDIIDDPNLTGKYLNFTKESFQSAQMAPYMGLFDFEADQSYNGTIFRLPFRSQRQGISDVKFDENEVKKIQDGVRKEGSKLLLFLQNVNSITFSRIEKGQTSPQPLLQVKKNLVSRNSNRSLRQEVHQQGEHAILSTNEVQVSVTNFQDDTLSKERWLIAGSTSGNHRVGAVACLLDQESHHVYLPKCIEGEAFCFLPLHDNFKTGLPVHVSANFAITNDRKAIHSSDSASASNLCQFNVSLMKTCIPWAYHKLLLAVKELCIVGRVAIDHYKFHSLWPLKSSLKAHNPWDHLILELYRLVPGSKLCYSEAVREWRFLADCKLLPKSILQSSQREDVEKAVVALQHPLIEIPTDCCAHLKESEGCISTISESQFLEEFFSNINRFPIVTRDSILLSLIVTFAKVNDGNPDPDYDETNSDNFDSLVQLPRREILRKFIDANCCIPCSPEGTKLRKCCEIINHRCKKLAPLYDPSEGRFIVESFRVPIIEGALQELGMISTDYTLPWDMITERARSVSAVYKSNKFKALERSKLLLHCVEEKLIPGLEYDTQMLHRYPESEELCSIPFLPVLPKPPDYPQELPWKGSGHDLLSASEMLMYSSKLHSMHLVAGSTVCIVSNETPPKGGCGGISNELASFMKITLLPAISDVLSQLENIANMKAEYSKDFSTWISTACKEIYSYIEMHLDGCRHLESSDRSAVKHKFESHPGLVWTGSEFINPSSIALEWHHNGPHLYRPPPFVSSRFYSQLLDFKEKFGTQKILDALEKFKETHGKESIPQHEREAVVAAVVALADSMEGERDPNFSCCLPDKNFCMRELQELVWNDAPWCEPDQNVLFVCDKIPRPTAMKLGVKTTLDHYSSSASGFEGVPFGQHEQLTQRIRDILNTYNNNEMVLKELLQNADDAGATMLYFILDERTHKTERLPSDEWKDLQGPALLVWNNRGFSDEDLVGIQRLGLGSKRSKSESVGHFGIGFNVTYHLTDCPSFFTNGSTLCIFDPHCKLPGANQRHPGRQWNNLDKEFWDKWCDLKPAYLQEGLRCPDEISSGGTLFRFPLRSTDELVKKSKLVDSEDCVPYTVSMMKDKLKEWAPKMRESMLFLKHVTKLCFFVIEEDATEMTTTHHFEAECSQDATENLKIFQDQCKKFTCEPHAVTYSYSLRLIEEAPKKQEEEWFVQQGIGDSSKPEEKWESLPCMKPTHGIAAKIRGSVFVPKVFCFLPLAQESKLPVHVNGNFVLDSSSRSDFWQSRDSNSPDAEAQWNERLIEAIGSSCAEFLVKCRSIMVCRSCYYDLFPRWIDVSHPPEGNMLRLARHTYKILGERRSKVLAVNVKAGCSSPPESNDSAKHDVDWHPVFSDDDPSQQIHFWPEPSSEPDGKYGETSTEQPGAVTASLPADSPANDSSATPPCRQDIAEILGRLGILLTEAPHWIWKHFTDKSIDIKPSLRIPEAKPSSVFEYYSKHTSKILQTNCKIKDSAFVDDKSFQLFIKFIATKDFKVNKLNDSTGYEEDCFKQFTKEQVWGLPLILTANGVLRVLDKENRVISSKHWEIFSRKQHYKFLHQCLLELKLHKSYFLEASDKNWDMVKEILASTLDCSLANSEWFKCASNFINIEKVLKPLWECLCRDTVMQKHIKQIVQEWALILSEEGELFKYDPNHGHLMPVVPPRKPKHRDPLTLTTAQKEDEDYRIFSELYEKFRDIGMPCVHSFICEAEEAHYSTFSKPESVLTDICPTFSKPKSILINLYHLWKSDSMEKINDIIPDIFSYFSRINFKEDETSLKKMKSLPLFECIDGKFRHLPDKAYLWPKHICKEGTKKLLQKNSAVFLDEQGDWKELRSNPDILGLHEIEPMTLYVEHLFPNFESLTKEERLCQLEHIRDSSELFNKAVCYTEEESTWQTNKASDSDNAQWSIDFVKKLKELPMLKKDGKLACINEFCHPDKAVFKFFPEHYTAIPEEFGDDKKWLKFFENIGLKTEPTKDEYKHFCHEVSKGERPDVKEASGALLECLFEVSDWHTDEVFLQEIREIPFVCAKNNVCGSEDHNCSICPSDCEQVVHQEGETQVRLTSLEKCAESDSKETTAAIIWTVYPVVDLPEVTFPKKKFNDFRSNERRRKKEEYEENFKKKLGVLKKPSASDVVDNMLNISLSGYSDFTLFEKKCIDTTDCNKCGLIGIISKCFSYLDELLTNLSENVDVSLLENVPCIPVRSDSKNDKSIPVLVEPLRVVSKIGEHQDALDLHPYLCSLPGEVRYFKVLREIGVNPEPKLNNIAYALKYLHLKITFPKNIVKGLLKLLYRQLPADKTSLKKMEVFHLPSVDNGLMKTTELIHDDLDYLTYTEKKFDFSSIPNLSKVSLTCNELDEFEEYDFQLSDLLDKLPEDLRPKELSKCSNESVLQIDHVMTPFACKLKEALKWDKFVQAVELGLYAKNKKAGSLIDKFTLSLKKLLTINVVAISDLEVRISKDNCIVGTAKAGFSLSVSKEILYVDADPLLFEIYKRIATCITKEALKKSRLSRSDLKLENAERIMGIILSGGKVDQIKMALKQMGVNPSLLERERSLASPRGSSTPSGFNTASPVYMLGGEIPVELHRFLRAAINNHFDPQELAGYRNESGEFVFVYVEYKMPQGDYVISFKEGAMCKVAVTDLYKILSSYIHQEDAEDGFHFSTHATHGSSFTQVEGTPIRLRQVTPNRDLAEVWYKQALHDGQAMKVLYDKAKGPHVNTAFNEKVCAHVCFFAHQVAEKVLTAGMYLRVGLSNYALLHRNMFCFANALRESLLDDAAAEVLEHVRVLCDYNLSTRYPNRCSNQVPSECFSLGDATKACKSSIRIFEIVRVQILFFPIP